VRRNSYRLPFLVVFVILAVLIIILAVGGGTNSSPSTTSDALASVSSTTVSSSDTTSTTEGNTSTTEETSSTETSTTEADTTSTSEDTSTTEDTTTESTSTTASTNPAVGGGVYTVEMSGGEVVPAVTTEASGKATFTVDDTGTRVSFTLEVTDLTDVSNSRVHVGAAGSNGSGVVVLLSGRYKEGPISGQIASGVFDASLLIGPLKGKTIADFVAMIKDGQAYVTVGSVKNPNGEIRGQIE
jgi:cytoskeletal protein RodZ